MRRTFIAAIFGIASRIIFSRSLAVRLKRILSSQLQTSETRGLINNHVVITVGGSKAPNIAVAAVEGFNVAEHVIRTEGRRNAAETAKSDRAERAGERQTGFTAEEAAALTHRAVVTIEAAFELEAHLIAVAEVFRTLQAPAVARIPTGLHIERIDSLFARILRVDVFEAGIESAVKRHVSSHCRAGKSAENGERSKSLFHFEIHSKSNLTEQNPQTLVNQVN